MLPEILSTPKRNLKRKSKCSNDNNTIKIQLTDNHLNHESVYEDTKLRLENITKSLKESLCRCEECQISCFDKISHLIEKHPYDTIKCTNCQKEVAELNIGHHLQNCFDTFLCECGLCNEGFACQTNASSHHESQCSKTKLSVVIDRSVSNDRDSTLKTDNASVCSQYNKMNEITFQKLLTMENCENTIIESELEKIMHSIESSSTIADEDYDFDEDDILFNTDFCVPQEEIDEISKICNELDKECQDKIIGNVKSIDYIGQDHYENKSVNAIYECHLCTELSTENFSDFSTHLLNHRNETVLKIPLQKRAQCNICGSVVPQIYFSEHLNLHRSHSRCHICKFFVLYAELESHVLAHKKHFNCMKCGETYKTKSAIIKHATHHLKGSTYSCEECKSEFASFEKLVCHISFDHKSIDPQFAECPFCFELTDNIKNHVYSTNCCKLKCKACFKVFKTSEEMISHMEQHQKNQKSENNQLDNIFGCKDCGWQGTKLKAFEAHMNYHKLNAMYSKHFPRKPRATCTICQTVVLESYLDYHVKKHRFYDKCPKCRKFVWKENIVEHIEMHQLDFTCKKCDEIFTTQKKLEDHEYAHARLIQRPCMFCHLVFNCEVSRWRHASQVHKNIDSQFVECNFCDELLTVDVEYHIYDPNYCQRRCKICERRFKDYSQYKCHLFRHHNQLLEMPVLN